MNRPKTAKGVITRCVIKRRHTSTAKHRKTVKAAEQKEGCIDLGIQFSTKDQPRDIEEARSSTDQEAWEKGCSTYKTEAPEEARRMKGEPPPSPGESRRVSEAPASMSASALLSCPCQMQMRSGVHPSVLAWSSGAFASRRDVQTAVPSGARRLQKGSLSSSSSSRSRAVRRRIVFDRGRICS